MTNLGWEHQDANKNKTYTPVNLYKSDMGSIPILELELLFWMELNLINLELEFPTKNEIQINLPFNFLIQKYFFHENLT